MSNKNKIIFVYPPVSASAYEWIERLGSKLPSIGLCSLAAYTREKGFETRILDAYNRGLTPGEALEQVLAFSPTHVGLTAMTSNIGFAGEFAGLVKKAKPGIVTVIGGTHVTALPEETMERFPWFDIGVLGEGEETITEILDLPADTGRKTLGSVKGIIYREEDGTLKKTAPRPFIRDLDRLPYPAWDLLDGFPKLYRLTPTNFKRLPAASLVTSRGCPYQCTFCDRSVFGNRYRSFSTGYIIGMIEELRAKYGIREICFYDDTFTVNRKHLAAFCEYLTNNNIKLSWSCLGRVDFADEALLRSMKRAGCWLISYGIESASPEILALYRKNTTIDQIINAVGATKKAGISSRGFFIIGGPLETDGTIRQLRDLLKRIPLDDIHLSFYTPTPGSELYDIARQYGTFERDWGKAHVYDLNYIPGGLTAEKLEKYRSDLYRGFYFHPRRMFRYLSIMLKPGRMKEIITRGWAFLKLINRKTNRPKGYKKFFRGSRGAVFQKSPPGRRRQK
jgi:anaerobic magnesium-protoporphyrin IX monomethyl ester cyclase